MSKINTFTPITALSPCLVFARLMALCLAFSTQVLAQDQELLRIYEVTLKPESVAQWTALQRDEAIPAMLEGGYDWVEVWGPGGAGDVYYRSLIVPIDGLDDLDEPGFFAEVMGEEKARDMLERNNAMVTSTRSLIVRPRPDLSFGTPPENPGVGVLTSVTIANGRTEEFERRLQGAVASELQESNVRSFRVSKVLFGGNANQYFSLLEFESMPNDTVVRPAQADRGHPTPLEWALGDVGLARVAGQENSPVISIDRVVLRQIGELSSR